MQATTPDHTGPIPVRSSIDEDIRQDVATAAWMMAVVTLPGLVILALMM